MSRDYAKQKRKASSKSSSFSDEATSLRDSLPLLLRTTTTSSTNPTPSVPSTPSHSFSPQFSYASYNENSNGDLFPTVSQLSSPPPSRQPSRRNSSFSETGVLEKDHTAKLTKFWESVYGRDDCALLPSIAEHPVYQSPSPAATSFGEKLKRIFRNGGNAVKMDTNRLAPGSFEGPNRERQIQDARDMYMTVVRNAERSQSEVPPYEFLELIGKGGYGRVYKCKHRGTGVLVAVKIINIDDADFQEHVLDKDNTISSFQKEVAILQQLKDNNAKNINIIHDAFDMHNQLWIVSDYCTGGSLRTLMRANPRKGFEEHYIIPVARELAIAIKSVHDIGVIHRDIKCANVYVNEEGDIQLGDFGIVGDVDDGSSKRRTIVGTPHYLPLEMHTAQSHQTDEAYGTEIDIWSFGITVYEMATGLPPYTHIPPDRLAEATVNAPRLEGGEYSDKLREFVAFCLNGDPKRRPSAAEVLRHPYIANTEQKYPTRGLVKLIERYAVWEYGGGQRQSLFFAGGAAAPVVPDDTTDLAEGDWNFSTSDNFNADFGKRYSQIVGTPDPMKSPFEAPAGAGLPPIVTKDLSRFEEVEQHFKELSANRGERSLDRVFNPTDEAPYELHTPVDGNDSVEPMSDLPLRNMAGPAAMRESLIDLDDVANLDLAVPTFNFDFGDGPTLKARTSRQAGRHDGEEEEYEYDADKTDERRATMEWTFPSVAAAAEKKRITMDWTFQTAVPAEPDDPEASMTLPAAGSDGLAPSFRPTLKHTTTVPGGQFGDFIHPAQSLLPTSSSPIRDSVGSMIDLDMGLVDPTEISRPSTAHSFAGSAMTDMTSGNPFDLEDDPEQNELDRDRFSYHKQWQSEGGHPNRLGYKHMPMHSRGSSLTSTDSELERIASESGIGDIYGYSNKWSESMRSQVTLQLPEEDTTMNHWPNFGADSGPDESPRYPASYVPQLGIPDYPTQQASRSTNGLSSHPTSAPRSEVNATRTPQRELEFPDPVGPHPDALLEDADPRVLIAELDRLLDDFGLSLRATARALQMHSGVLSEEASSETDSGVESSSAAPTGDEDGF
ncbi:hypothetical protein LTR91_022725 [Friedmanniomyces endolithicus]|uniref:non-specific serine/threonine protein kinase n=1 Tax=Friedmanniomyces endolithicus TaxID=329885 RepID=A0AAN6H7P8_9PEZI|nr:hypothetical protein LTR75_013912 [Friedmanniomyces endolithicus]KAK0794919.1 hypothetical protein LTR59_007625 [Friedmanniomyces endolithicus]KAK0955695.1 hypothetical protein LTR91_022725 [Friedmanniomyces endolithicus]